MRKSTKGRKNSTKLLVKTKKTLLHLGTSIIRYLFLIESHNAKSLAIAFLSYLVLLNFSEAFLDRLEKVFPSVRWKKFKRKHVKWYSSSTKNIISLLPQFGGHETWRTGELPWRPPTHKSHESLIIWSCEITLQIKKQYLEYQILYCHQTWQDIYLPWWGSTHEVTWPFYYVSCKITWQIKTIFSTILPMTTKLCNMGSS